jgi:hypothetical protein
MKFSMIKTLNSAFIFTLSTVVASANAVQISFEGGSNIGNLTTVVGNDGLGDTWQTNNGSLLLNSNFAMADSSATPQPFNPINFTNGAGNFATSFRLTINNSQQVSGFRGINLGPVSSGLINNFTVKTDVLDPSTWTTWDISYNLFDSVTGLFQQATFTAPSGTRLSQGTSFSTNLNFSGIMTSDSGWSASFSDQGSFSAVPVPASILLLLTGFAAVALGNKRST